MQMGNVGPRNRIFERREEAQMGNGREKTSTPVLVPPAGRKEGRFQEKRVMREKHNSISTLRSPDDEQCEQSVREEKGRNAKHSVGFMFH